MPLTAATSDGAMRFGCEKTVPLAERKPSTDVRDGDDADGEDEAPAAAAAALGDCKVVCRDLRVMPAIDCDGRPSIGGVDSGGEWLTTSRGPSRELARRWWPSPALAGGVSPASAEDETCPFPLARFERDDDLEEELLDFLVLPLLLLLLLLACSSGLVPLLVRLREDDDDEELLEELFFLESDDDEEDEVPLSSEGDTGSGSTATQLRGLKGCGCEGGEEVALASSSSSAAPTVEVSASSDSDLRTRRLRASSAGMATGELLELPAPLVAEAGLELPTCVVVAIVAVVSGRECVCERASEVNRREMRGREGMDTRDARARESECCRRRLLELLHWWR